MPKHNINLFELDFIVKFPLSRLLQFLSDLKSTIMCTSLYQSLNTIKLENRHYNVLYGSFKVIRNKDIIAPHKKYFFA